MNRHCVQCGKQTIPAKASKFQTRCIPCFRAWIAAGRIRATKWVSGKIGGVRTGGTKYENHALFCKLCGGRIPPKSHRQIFALKRGGECTTCDDCHNNKRFPSQR